MFTAICKRNCIFRGKYWEEGEVYKGKAEPPSHFEVTGRPAEDKPATKEKKNEPEGGK